MFSGQCEEAFRFYERVLGGQLLTLLTYGSSPLAEQVPLEWLDKIIHATLAIAGGALSGTDVLPEQFERPQGFYVLLGITEPADADRVFAALAKDGTVRMPIQQTFWAVRFGALVDRFGTPWEVNCGQGAASDGTTSNEFQVSGG
jgi:PhnB protein